MGLLMDQISSPEVKKASEAKFSEEKKKILRLLPSQNGRLPVNFRAWLLDTFFVGQFVKEMPTKFHVTK